VALTVFPRCVHSVARPEGCDRCSALPHSIALANEDACRLDGGECNVMETESDSGDPESDDGSMIGGNDLSNRYGIVPIESSLSVTRAGNTASRATHRRMFPVWGHTYTNISEYGFVTLVDDFLTLSYITDGVDGWV
jgi:hypothetical protein